MSVGQAVKTGVNLLKKEVFNICSNFGCSLHDNVQIATLIFPTKIIGAKNLKINWKLTFRN